MRWIKLGDRVINTQNITNISIAPKLRSFGDPETSVWKLCIVLQHDNITVCFKDEDSCRVQYNELIRWLNEPKTSTNVFEIEEIEGEHSK